MTRTPAFRHVGGDILFWAKPLTTDDVNHFRALYRDEAWAAFHAGDDADYQRCADILKEIVDAMSEQASVDAVRRPQQPPRPARGLIPTHSRPPSGNA